LYTVDWESSSRKDPETGFLFATRFSKNNANLIISGGAGKNELKVFENNADGSASFRVLASITELEAPILSIDTNKGGD
jgi:hypothetical protein